MEINKTVPPCIKIDNTLLTKENINIVLFNKNLANKIIELITKKGIIWITGKESQ
jgi:hypothetical protein